MDRSRLSGPRSHDPVVPTTAGADQPDARHLLTKVVMSATLATASWSCVAKTNSTS
jgi:hypothetical protein